MSQSQEHPITWQPAVNQRGTFTIITMCLSTLVICIWSSLHLSIPNKRRTGYETLKAKLLWAAIGLLLPEILIWVAWRQRMQAVEIRDRVNKHFGLNPPKSWYRGLFGSTKAKVGSQHKDKEAGITHGLGTERALVRSNSDGGSVSGERRRLEHSEGRSSPGLLSEERDSQTSLVSDQGLEPEQSTNIGRDLAHREAWSLTQGFYLMMGGLAFVTKHKYEYWTPEGWISHRKDWMDDWHQRKTKSDWGTISGHSENIDQLLKRHPGIISHISIHAILNQSKTDGLAKSILLLQVVWFCISCLHRLIQHLPLTLLEVSTVAHALCSMTVYVIWWDKPLNIQEPMIIPGAEEHRWYFRSSSALHMELRNDFHLNDLFNTPAIDSAIVLTLVGFIYGTPHLLAWNSAFATHTEQLLWRIASCTVAFIPLFSLVNIVFVSLLYRADDYFHIHITSCTAGVYLFGVIPLTAFIYFPASLYLIASSIRQLFYLTPAAFQVPPWTNYFPHVS